jgi:hypothetical protein
MAFGQHPPRETLIKSIHGFDQLALQEARLLDASIFKCLGHLKLPGHP